MNSICVKSIITFIKNVALESVRGADAAWLTQAP